MLNRSDMLAGMKEIGLRDLPSVLSATVKDVQSGDSVILTKYNRPAAVLVGVGFYERAVKALESGGEGETMEDPGYYQRTHGGQRDALS